MNERYEDVRDELVRRGYLQGRIERFLLRDVIASAASTRTSVRAAVVGAPLLGGWLAASTVAANRPALGVRDALVLWLYFGVVSGVALFALDLAAAAMAGAWARRRGPRASDALRAGLFVAAPVAAYLALLWALRGPDRGLGADALFLAGAVAATALVGWLAGVVSLAAIVGRTGEVPDRLRRSALTRVLVLVPVAIAVLLIASAWSPRAGVQAPSEFATPPHPERVLVVGVDGLDGSLVEAMTARGATARLLEVLARGAIFPARRPSGLEPAEVWTTVATGMPVEAHGVRSAGVLRLPGLAAPIAEPAHPGAFGDALRLLLPGRTVATSGATRRVRALWEIAGLAHPSAAVGWWASWPARGTEGDAADGYVVSDRTLAKILSGAAEDHDTSPASLFARLARDFPSGRDALRAAFEPRFAAFPEKIRALAWESCLIDGFAWTTTRRLLDDPAVASAFVYLPGLDILRARLASGAAGDDVLEAYVRWLDDDVFEGVAASGVPRVVLVADPGRNAGEGAEGFLAISGGGVSPSCVGPPIALLDVAPAVLRALALPASREMQGVAPRTCFEGAPAAPPPIATWGRRGRPAESALAKDDPEMLERLKSLGYLR
jgi:hypothetical protein